MIGFHPPFRRATPEDRQAVARLCETEGCITPPGQGEPSLENVIVGEENGRLFAVLAGRRVEAGDTWQVEVLVVSPERSFNEFGARLLAIADALAADEGLAKVNLHVDQATDHVLAVLDHEGFRRDGLENAAVSMSRPVVPQG